MPITVNSPFSGHPVKIRDADINRAVRDEEGRVFYVVQRASGDGYYSAPTRKGSAKDEQRYDDLAAKMAVAHQQATAQVAAVHDATGRRRARPWLRVLILLAILAALAIGAWVIFLGGEPADLRNPLGDPPIPTDPLDLPTPTPTPEVRAWIMVECGVHFARACG